jgi:hypothetical protein
MKAGGRKRHGSSVTIDPMLRLTKLRNPLQTLICYAVTLVTLPNRSVGGEKFYDHIVATCGSTPGTTVRPLLFTSVQLCSLKAPSSWLLTPISGACDIPMPFIGTVCYLLFECHGWHGRVTAMSRLRSQKKPVVIDLSRRHGYLGGVCVCVSHRNRNPNLYLNPFLGMCAPPILIFILILRACCALRYQVVIVPQIPHSST